LRAILEEGKYLFAQSLPGAEEIEAVVTDEIYVGGAEPELGHSMFWFATSLNDLDYRSPAGFAWCRLSARGSKQKEIS
jgi:hypothetical protein